MHDAFSMLNFDSVILCGIFLVLGIFVFCRGGD